MAGYKIALLIFCVTAVSAYNPDLQNVYHLFTVGNPSVSQPMRLGNDALLLGSNFNPSFPTVLLIHGWLGSPTSEINTVLVPAYLQTGPTNIFVVDWSDGSGVLAGTNAPQNAVLSGVSVARFVNWILFLTGASLDNFTIVGHSLGAHQAGVVGRNVNGRIPYIVGLDPGANMEDSGHLFGPDAATYTEAIHTNAEVMGHGSPLAHVDMYPNGGDFMPGCGITSFLCNHLRAIFFFAESLTTSHGFTARSCGTYTQARLGLCFGLQTTRMGGLTPKTGTNGLFHLETNAEPPFNRG